MKTIEKRLLHYETKHNIKFPDSPIKVTGLVDKYIYFQTEFGECKMYIGNVGKATYSILSATNRTEFLISRLKKLHGDIYDYSLVVFSKTNEKVYLICKKHGEFKKVVNSLLCNENIYCPNCYNESIRGMNRVSSAAVFIEKAKKIHNDLYDYSKLVYKTAKEKVEILCPIHGSFMQTAYSHLTGYGCMECARELTGWNYTNWENKGNKSKDFDSFKLYIIRCWNENEEFYKIGKTYRTMMQRFNSKKAFPYNYEILQIIKGDAKEISILENTLKSKNKQYKYSPKINFGGETECFNKIIK